MIRPQVFINIRLLAMVHLSNNKIFVYLQIIVTFKNQEQSLNKD